VAVDLPMEHPPPPPTLATSVPLLELVAAYVPVEGTHPTLAPTTIVGADPTQVSLQTA
jgi:hypothetical protein